MKPTHSPLPSTAARAFTSLELLVVLASMLIVAALILPAFVPRRCNCVRANCVNNLKQVGLAFRIWSEDNNNKFPMDPSIDLGSNKELINGTNTFAYFQLMSNELSTPKIIVCPEDKKRHAATNFDTDLDNSKLSYFAGLDASTNSPAMLLSGDRHLAVGKSARSGILNLTTKQEVGWTRANHKGLGNVVLVDGSVQQFTTAQLRKALASTGVTTNRLTFP
ncbi:MAG: prepilin-type N-terminal cleavage/methylation domain [Pedosphaera sp.]|nr:prepilin-type N-terminal cleavage/methylation domain [Pedosphaera sp.]